MRRRLAVAAIAVAAVAVSTGCDPDPGYAAACYLEGGTPRAVKGSSPLQGWCDHPGPDNAGSQAERSRCYQQHIAPGPCDAVSKESFRWVNG